MSKSIYWGFAAIALGFGLLGAFALFHAPSSTIVDSSELDAFYRGQYVWAGGIGVVFGVAAGWYYPRHLYHQPREHDATFNHRTAWRGFWFGIFAAIVSAIVAGVFATSADFGSLSPVDSIILVSSSGLFGVVLSIAIFTALLAYAIMTRVRRWGGQYALIKRVGTR